MIVVVNGFVIGGGLCLVLVVDIWVVLSSVYFWVVGINNGLIVSELGLSYLLFRVIGFLCVFEIMLIGCDVSVEEVVRIGLVFC